MDESDEIALLKKHYKENILLDLETEKEKVTEEKREFSRHEFLKVFEPDLSDFEKTWGFAAPPFVAATLSEENYSVLRKMLGLGNGVSGIVTNESAGIMGIFVSDGTENNSTEHEMLHGLYKMTSQSSVELRGAPGMMTSEKFCELESLLVETDGLLGQIFAYRSDLKKKCKTREEIADALKSSYYAGNWSGYLAGFVMGEYANVLPESGAVSRHKAEQIAWESTNDYFKEKVDAGMAALEILEENLTSQEVTKILLSIGPTRKEFESDIYLRPIDELVLWSRHYKEILADA